MMLSPSISPSTYSPINCTIRWPASEMQAASKYIDNIGFEENKHEC